MTTVTATGTGAATNVTNVLGVGVGERGNIAVASGAMVAKVRKW